MSKDRFDQMADDLIAWNSWVTYPTAIACALRRTVRKELEAVVSDLNHQLSLPESILKASGITSTGRLELARNSVVKRIEALSPTPENPRGKGE